MSFEKDPAKANPSEPQFQQTALRDVTARDIQIGQIVQTIVNLGLPFNSQHLRFAQFLANTVYASLLLGGFWRLWQQGADEKTLLMLLLGSMLLSLTGVYYAWFWKPRGRDKRSRQFRRLAMVACVAVPLLTGSGFFVWNALPLPHVLVLVANFANSQNADYRDDRGVTGKILRNLRKATEPYPDVKVQPLDQTIRAQEGSKARAIGEQKKAAIVIWGDYDVSPTNVLISVHYERLRAPEYFPELGDDVDGKARILAIAELNSFKLQTRLSEEMSYLTLFTLGMLRYAEQDWDGAIDRFNSALDQVQEPVSALSQEVVHIYRGNSHYNKSDYQNAIADFNQVIQLNPKQIDAYNSRGNAYDEQGNHERAITDYNQALQLEPNNAITYFNRGIAYDRQGDSVQAIADLNRAIQLKPDLAGAYYSRGIAYFHQGNVPQAIADYTQSLKLRPDYVRAYNNRGLAYASQGSIPQAIADYTQAIQLNPNLAEAYYVNRGVAYASQHKYQQSIADYNQAIQLNPNLAEAYINRGGSYLPQGNITQAIADFDRAIHLNPNLAEAYNNRGSAYFEQGNDPKAIADFNRAIQLNPSYAEAYANRAGSYSMQENYAQAIADCNQALKFDPDLVVAYNNRGNAYAYQGNTTQAIADFNQTIQRNPDFALAYYNKARAYSLQRDIKAALENLQRAIDLDAGLRDAAKTDADFDSIRQDRKFQKLIGQ